MFCSSRKAGQQGETWVSPMLLKSAMRVLNFVACVWFVDAVVDLFCERRVVHMVDDLLARPVLVDSTMGISLDVVLSCGCEMTR